MKRMLFAVTFSLLVMAACASAPDDSNPTVDPNSPVSSDDPVPPAEELPPIEGPVIRGEAVVESIQILMLESFPLQVHVAAQGYVPDGCTRVDQISQKRDGNTFNVTITTVRPEDMECTEAEVPFQENIPLDVYGLPAGTYTVDVNGVTDTFTFDTDNILPDMPSDDQGNTEGPLTDLATIESAEVEETTMVPPAVQVNIKGTIPDGCVGYLQVVRERRQANVIHLTVGRSLPDGVMCTMVITEFEESTIIHDLESGSYILQVNDFTTEFTVGKP